ncbi:MAG: TVP38/TMEM64 family protein [Deltaproteobacteria bacterium]|nr:TVP38/TMEM64 family protein [Deltaproteobacteria bacterium]
MKKILSAQDKVRLAIAGGIITAAWSVIAYLAYSGQLDPLICAFWETFASRDHLRTYVESWGRLAPLAFIVIQAFQVVFAPIPGEFTGAVGGFIFGGLPNVFYSTVGLGFGSAAAFLAARIVGLPIVNVLVPDETLKRFHFLTEGRGIALALLLFVIPGFPKDFLCYILGLSPMNFLPFVLVSALGRIPGTVLLSLCGSAVYNENWALLFLISTITAVALVLVVFYRERLDSWLRNSRG